MFETLSHRLDKVFNKLRGRGRLSDSDVTSALRDVRLAMLEADVNFKVVKGFISSVKERAVGVDVMKSLTPGQQVIKIVHEELVALMGKDAAPLASLGDPPMVILLAGLHGSGKTTTAGKLARHFKEEGKLPYLIPCDLMRPAGVEQLCKVAQSLDVPVFNPEDVMDPVAVAEQGLKAAQVAGAQVVIADSAGRNQANEELIGELTRISSKICPEERLLVVDAMTGQQAVDLAKAFHNSIELTGVILTKLDGDARGGAALSIRAEVGIPIKLVGVGERMDALETFHPERMASRILGMGDMLSLIERAQTSVSVEEAAVMAEKARTLTFSLEDFRDQICQLKKMGPMEELVGMIPGMNKLKGFKGEGDSLTKIEAMINSMTPEERQDHSIISGGRRKRIAVGSGTTVQDVNQLLKQFLQMRKMMQQITRVAGGKKGKRALMMGVPGIPGLPRN
jgi:signal recognition particle subunit SRP54